MIRAAMLGFLLLGLAACSDSLPPESFSTATPLFVPEDFFAGHLHSYGVIETTGAAPQLLFEGDNNGTRNPDGTLDLAQVFTFSDGTSHQRHWHFVKADEHHYTGTADDVVGIASGEAYGNLFHWRYTVRREEGKFPREIDFEQWMYLQPDGTVVNRGRISKFGIAVAGLTEYFVKDDR
jgi:hypothetical protein